MRKGPIEPTKYRYSCVECGLTYARPRNEVLCDDCIAKEQVELKAGKAIPISAAKRLAKRFQELSDDWDQMNESKTAKGYQGAIMRLEEVIREYEKGTQIRSEENDT